MRRRSAGPTDWTRLLADPLDVSWVAPNLASGSQRPGRPATTSTPFATRHGLVAQAAVSPTASAGPAVDRSRPWVTGASSSLKRLTPLAEH